MRTQTSVCTVHLFIEYPSQMLTHTHTHFGDNKSSTGSHSKLVNPHQWTSGNIYNSLQNWSRLEFYSAKNYLLLYLKRTIFSMYYFTYENKYTHTFPAALSQPIITLRLFPPLLLNQPSSRSPSWHLSIWPVSGIFISILYLIKYTHVVLPLNPSVTLTAHHILTGKEVHVKFSSEVVLKPFTPYTNFKPTSTFFLQLLQVWATLKYSKVQPKKIAS